MKIENAIILAAGRGSRMLDITNDIPKPLLISTINDKTFIENIIESLQLANIKEIIIVVGYKSDKFEFLKKNYNVKLIKNNNWENTNNITSLNAIKDFLKNSLIINGDVVIKDNSIIKNEYPCSSTFAEKNEFINEWLLKVDENNNIVEIVKDGSKYKGLFQREVTILSDEMSKAIKKEINNFDKNEYFELLVLYCSKKYNIDFKPFVVDKNLIYDVDSKEKYINELKEKK